MHRTSRQAKPAAVLLLALFLPLPAGQTEASFSLEQAVAMAVANHPQLRLARQEIALAEAERRRSGSIPAPELSVGWDAMPGLLRFG